MTAVEWLELNLLGLISFDSEELRVKYKERVAKAKEMEKQQGYSEEDMAQSCMACWVENVPYGIECKVSFNQWFEQFKNN